MIGEIPPTAEAKRPTLLILAAGVGSRYGGLKQLAPIGPGGEALLEYSVYDAVEAGFSRVVLVVRPEDEIAFRRHLDGGMGRRIPIRYVPQTLDALPRGFSAPPSRTRPWGTGQAVLVAREEIDGPFGVLNADDYYGVRPFAELARFFATEVRRGRPTLAVVAYEVSSTLTEAGPVSRALCRVDDEGRLLDIAEIKRVWRQDGHIRGIDARGEEIRLGDSDLVSMNMWGLDPELFPELQQRFSDFLRLRGGESEAEFLLPDVVRSLCHEGRVEVRVLPGARQWCGITFKQDQPRVAGTIADLVSAGRYPRELWA